jgi:hypothetical protein
MIVLRGDYLLVRIDRRHGGEILDLVDCVSGRQLLGRPPFAPSERIEGDLDEATWTGAYRGGWQLLTPNAGNGCTIGGELHGFHGRASNDPWAVADLDATSTTLRWAGHDLEVTRSFEIAGDCLDVRTTFQATADRVPFVAVEHCSLGLELLDPAVEICLPGGRAYELSEVSGPEQPPAGAPAWPNVSLLDGSVERGDRWSLGDVRGRFLAVADLPVGRADVINAQTGTGLSLEWDREMLPHLWIWHEARFSGGVWRGCGEILCVEPASVPHSLGLGTAIANGQAHWVEPGQALVQRVSARPLRQSALRDGGDQRVMHRHRVEGQAPRACSPS